MNLTTTTVSVLVLAFTFTTSIFANNASNYRENNLPKNNILDNKLDIVSIEKEFSANGRFYTHSAQQLSPQTGYYRLLVTNSNGEKTMSNPFTVSDDFSRESFAFCCDEPDTETLSQNTFTVIDSIADFD